MRTFLLITSGLVCAGVLAVVAGRASASSTATFEGTFQTHYGRGVAPLPCAVDFCFAGTVAGYGQATLSGFTTSVTPIPGNQCADVTELATIAFPDGSTLALDGGGTVCPPGNSADAPGSLVSYGNPRLFTGTYTITGGSGAFAGANGSGTFHDDFAGDIQTVHVKGSLALP